MRDLPEMLAVLAIFISMGVAIIKPTYDNYQRQQLEDAGIAQRALAHRQRECLIMFPGGGIPFDDCMTKWNER